MTWFNVVKNESIEAKNKAKEFSKELKIYEILWEKINIV